MVAEIITAPPLTPSVLGQQQATLTKPVVKKRHWSFVGDPAFSRFKLRDLVIDLDKVTDEDIQAFLPTHPELGRFFKKVE